MKASNKAIAKRNGKSKQAMKTLDSACNVGSEKVRQRTGYVWSDDIKQGKIREGKVVTKI